jgi:hypothetical protein
MAKNTIVLKMNTSAHAARIKTLDERGKRQMRPANQEPFQCSPGGFASYCAIRFS